MKRPRLYHRLNYGQTEPLYLRLCLWDHWCLFNHTEWLHLQYCLKFYIVYYLGPSLRWGCRPIKPIKSLNIEPHSQIMLSFIKDTQTDKHTQTDSWNFNLWHFPELSISHVIVELGVWHPSSELTWCRQKRPKQSWFIRYLSLLVWPVGHSWFVESLWKISSGFPMSRNHFNNSHNLKRNKNRNFKLGTKAKYT